MSGKPDQVLKTTMAGCRRSFVHVGLFSLFINLLMLTVSLYMLQIFDRVIASQSLRDPRLPDADRVGRDGLWASWSWSARGFWSGSALDRAEPGARGLRAKRRGALPGAYRTQALRDLGQLRSFLGGSAIFALFDAPGCRSICRRIFCSIRWSALSRSAAQCSCSVRRPQRTAHPHTAARGQQAAIRAMQRAEATAATPRRSTPWA